MTEYNLLSAMGEAEEELLERSLRHPAARKWIAWAVGFAACLCLVTVLALRYPAMWNGTDTTGDQGGREAADSCSDASGTGKRTTSDIHVKELTGEITHVASDIGISWEDLTAMTAEQLELYYGTTIRPDWVPEDLTDRGLDIGGVFGSAESARENDTPYYDQNTLTYADTTEWSWQHGKYATKADWEAAVAAGRSLTVTAAGSDRGIFHDAILAELEDARADGEYSTVHDVEMLVYHYTEQEADFYGARYKNGGAEVEVIGKNLTLDEFTRVLESLL